MSHFKGSKVILFKSTNPFDLIRRGKFNWFPAWTPEKLRGKRWLAGQKFRKIK